jgi:Glycosyl hydrolases family 38 N-terminal domain
MKRLSVSNYSDTGQCFCLRIEDAGVDYILTIPVALPFFLLAWLWPFSVTQQKVARSWSTQCDLMERYPEHTFTCSTAQQVKWLEELYPSLFKVVKSKVREGRFQMVGGSWVESDTNMPSGALFFTLSSPNHEASRISNANLSQTGEALIRQFLFGQRYFKSRFGEYCKVAWLPDTCVLATLFWAGNSTDAPMFPPSVLVIALSIPSLCVRLACNISLLSSFLLPSFH